MAYSIYEPCDARNAYTELVNTVMNKLYYALEECGGECILDESVPMMEGADVIMVCRVYTDGDNVCFEGEDGEEDDLWSVADITGLCDIWEYVKSNK